MDPLRVWKMGDFFHSCQLVSQAQIQQMHQEVKNGPKRHVEKGGSSLTLRIIGPSKVGVWICIAGFWDLQTTSFEFPWFLE